MNDKTDPHVGKKVLYTVVILLSSLLILLSAAGILGVWLVKDPLSDSAVAVLSVVEESTVTVRQATNRLDQGLSRLGEITTVVSDASEQLSQDVTDKGLIMVLLPEEQEQKLAETAGSIQETFAEIRASITNVLELYRSINRLPFVNLPGLDADQMEAIESSVANTQAQAESLRTELAAFRSGVSGKVDKVSGAAAQLNEAIGQGRDKLSQLDARLAELEALAIRLQQVIPGVLLAMAVILTLLLAYLIFTQVEVIRLYVDHWRQLGPDQEDAPTGAPAETPEQPVQIDGGEI